MRYLSGLLLVGLVGCGTPQYVKDKIAVENEVHIGYMRLAPSLTTEELLLILEADAKAWKTLDQVVKEE